jgi:hypothetical protein
LLLLLLFLPSLVIHSGIGIGVIIHQQFHRDKRAKIRLFSLRLTEQDSDLSLGCVETVDHVGQRIALLPALSHHVFHRLPGIPALLHHADDLQDRLDFRHVLLDELRLTTISLLFLDQFLHTLFLILPDLLVLLPGQFLEGLFLLMRRVLVLAEVLSHRETESLLLGARPFGELAIAEGRELEVFFALGVEVPWLLLTQEALEEIETMLACL